ncbi:MAG: ComEC/Rec2 family competence protein [Treponemataceae bacterium]|nr:ComEC/Rec2 family competence protein [Treponemataceae bacterium]
MVKKLTHPIVIAALACAILVYSGLVRVRPRAPFVSLFAHKNIVRLDGMVASNPVKAADGTYRADFAVRRAYEKSGASATARGTVSVRFPAEIVEALYPGKIYTAASAAVLCETGAYLSLSVSPRFRAGDFSVTHATADGWGRGLAGKIRHFRARCRLYCRRLLYAWGDAGGLLLALVSGSREYTDSAVADAFRYAGLSHILALSGMHLSLVGGLALAVGRRVAGRRIAETLQLAAIVFFVWFAGLSPSLFRALVCALIPFVCAKLSLRRPDAVVVLCAAFLLHLMVFPGHLQSAAFMLSYGALAGILLLGAPIRRLLCARIVPAISDALSASAAAQVFTAPITLRLFGCLMPVGIVASVAVAPLVTWFLYAGLCGMVVCLAFPCLAPAVGFLLDLLYDAVRGLAGFFARFPVLSIIGKEWS